MSVVGLTLGSGAKAIRPSVASAASVATSATVREEGRERSYHAKPAASASARMRERRERPAHGSDSIAVRARGQLGDRLRRGEDAAVAAEDARGLGREVPAAGEQLGGARVGDDAAVGEQDRARREARRELGVVRRDERPRRRAPTSATQLGREQRLAPSGPSRASARRGRAPPAARSPPVTIASASRWRSPPEQSRGWRSASAARPARSSAAASSSSPTRSWTK